MHIMYCKVFSNLSHEVCQKSLLLTRCHCFRFKMHSVVQFICLHTVHDLLRVWVLLSVARLGHGAASGAQCKINMTISIPPPEPAPRLGTGYPVPGVPWLPQQLVYTQHLTCVHTLHWCICPFVFILRLGTSFSLPPVLRKNLRNGVETNIRILIKIISLEYSYFD